MSYAALTLRFWLALVCAVAVMGKVSNRRRAREFLRFVQRMGIAPRWIRPAAAGVVLAEGAVAVTLALPATAFTGSVAAAGLFLVLTIGVWRVVRDGDGATPRCFCFGRLGAPLGRTHIIRNVTLTVVGVAATILTWLGGSVSVAGAALAILCSMLLALLVVAWEDIAALLTDGPVRAGERMSR